MGGMTDLSDSHTISIGVLDNDSLALNAIAVMTSRLSPRFHIIWSTTSPAMALQRLHDPRRATRRAGRRHGLGRHHRRGHMRQNPSAHSDDRLGVRHLL